MQNELLKADAFEILRVLDFLKFSHSFKNRQKLIESLSPGSSINLETISRVKKFPKKTIEDLSKYVENKCNAIESNYILYLLNGQVEQRYKDEDLSQREQYINDVLSTFFAGDDQNIKAISAGNLPEACCNQQGKYLLFSASHSGRYRVAAMRVFYKKGLRSILPVFVTRRYSPETDEGEVRGVLFQSGETVYAAGKVTGTPPQFRVSKLNLSYRPSRDRTDLYGLRLSHSAQINRPFAYRIFAYQINDSPRYQQAITYLKSKSDFGNEIFQDLDIKIPETIEQRIHGQGALPVGLTVVVPNQL
ncbi:MAG: hypothetical protein AAFR02_00020 [Pseudomonadota bacterium]